MIKKEDVPILEAFKTFMKHATETGNFSFTDEDFHNFLIWEGKSYFVDDIMLHERWWGDTQYRRIVFFEGARYAFDYAISADFTLTPLTHELRRVKAIPKNDWVYIDKE